MPDDLHEWVSFEDPDEDRTWVFDLTFLTSRGRASTAAAARACSPARAEDLEQGCCSYGAHFVDEDDEATTLEAKPRGSTPSSGSSTTTAGARGRPDQAQQGRRDQ